MKKISMLVVLSLTLMLMVSNGAYAGTKPAELSSKHGDIVAQQDESSLSGKVVETMNSGGYTYCNIERNGKKIWVAVPETQVKVGQTLSFQPGMPMENFESKTLHRTFDTIIFSGGIMEQGSGSAAESAGHKKAEVPAAAKAIKVKKASGANAYTVAELYHKRSELDKKEVVVRGQVVKVSAEIMGKNWIHIQDGTGDASKGTDDILVTSKDLPSVGDTVTAKGTLAKDKDFGSGYKYSVIVEEGSIKK